MPIGDSIQQLLNKLPLPDGAKLILIRHRYMVQPAYIDDSYLASDAELHEAGFSPATCFSFKKEPIFPLSQDERSALLGAGATDINNRIYSF